MGCIYFVKVLNDFVSKLVVTQNIFPLFLRHCDQGLIVVIIYYFKIGNKKKNITLVVVVEVELLVVTWVPCLLSHPIFDEPYKCLLNICLCFFLYRTKHVLSGFKRKISFITFSPN